VSRANFLAVPRRFTFGLSSLAYFSQFQLSPKPKVSVQRGRDSAKSKFTKYLEAAVALQSCPWRTFPSCGVCYIQCTTPRREASAIQSALILAKAMLCHVQSPNICIFKEPKNLLQGINSASICRLAGRYDNPIPTRFLAPVNFLKIPAQYTVCERKRCCTSLLFLVKRTAV
jgi:hypothetical protein